MRNWFKMFEEQIKYRLLNDCTGHTNCSWTRSERTCLKTRYKKHISPYWFARVLVFVQFWTKTYDSSRWKHVRFVVRPNDDLIFDSYQMPMGYLRFARASANETASESHTSRYGYCCETIRTINNELRHRNNRPNEFH